MKVNCFRFTALLLGFGPLLIGCSHMPRVDEVNSQTSQSTLNEMTVALVLSKTPNIKLIHQPNSQVRADLAAKGVRLNNAGCPWGWELDRPGWMHPDVYHSTAGCMFNDQAHYDLPIQVDYWPKTERPDVNVDRIER